MNEDSDPHTEYHNNYTAICFGENMEAEHIYKAQT